MQIVHYGGLNRRSVQTTKIISTKYDEPCIGSNRHKTAKVGYGVWNRRFVLKVMAV